VSRQVFYNVLLDPDSCRVCQCIFCDIKSELMLGLKCPDRSHFIYFRVNKINSTEYYMQIKKLISVAVSFYVCEISCAAVDTWVVSRSFFPVIIFSWTFFPGYNKMGLHQDGATLRRPLVR
jgi:hypothetical protein